MYYFKENDPRLEASTIKSLVVRKMLNDLYLFSLVGYYSPKRHFLCGKIFLLSALFCAVTAL